jgi:RNA polymerase sigma-70 factor, ECF subfamily
VAFDENSKNEDGTLGALLYADPTRARVPESEWVALVRAVTQGDQLALRALYDRAHRLVFTLALRITGCRQTAEELTLDVFMGVWQRAGTYDARVGPVIAWIMNLARSRSIDRLRYQQRSKRSSAGGIVDPAHEASVPDTGGRDLDLKAEADLLRLALVRLPQLERELIEAAYFRDLSYAEVAREFGEPLGTVKTRIRAGFARLRKVLGRWETR